MATKDELVAVALEARKESRHVEFVAARPPWPELLKDVAAMANSGGGAIVLGRNRDGSDSGWDPSELLRLDRAEIVAAFAPFVGERFDDFAVVDVSNNGSRVAVIVVPARLHAPIVFEKAGTYTDGSREKTAFARGTIYFRHGARSAPGTARDLERFIAHEVDDQRRGWARNVRKVAGAPRDAQVLVVKPKQAIAVPEVRVVDDPNAPTLARTDFDLTHPYRQTEVVRTINERAGRKLVSGYDLQCVRKVYDIADRPEFFHRPKFGSPQYSEAFVSWLIAEWQKDPEFFEKAKAVVHPPRVEPEGSGG